MLKLCLKIVCIWGYFLFTAVHAQTYLVSEKITLDGRYTLEYREDVLVLVDTIGADHQTIHISKDGPLEGVYNQRGQSSMPMVIDFNPKGFLVATGAKLSLSGNYMGIQYIKRYGWGYRNGVGFEFGGHGVIGVEMGIQKKEFIVIDQDLSVKLFLAKDVYIFLGSPAAEKLREDVYQILGTANVSIREGSQASSSIAREQAARLQVQAAERQHEAALREKARRQELKRIQDEAEKREQAQIASIVDQKILALHPDIRLGVDVEKCNTRAERSSTGHVRYQVTLLKYGNGRSLDFSDPKMVFAKHTFDFDLDPDWIEGKQVTQASSSSSSAASAPAKPSTARATILFPSVPPEEISSNAFTLSDSNSDHEWLRVVMQTASVEHKNDFGTELQWRAISHEGEPVGFIVDGHKNPSEMLSLFGSRARTNTVIGDGLGGYRTIVFKEGYHIAEKRDGEWSFFSGYFGSTSRKPFYFCHTATNACSLLE